ncbi:helix-turn-helix domain-containing protein [Streptomyces sp. NPDC054766]|uniref:helix-turn-helix domain-containing protein n=1 Tax=Streptomyces rhizosphaerihabitans TaxID=1266770 RepID=UPI0021C158EF|nr:helix-turn-helix domain-containing protein [Streptomyces rhizosphaerihabitans]MCT9011762.1 helix-turn-helix domain-containing protein [Streptomyces rhizosphaerihabitans]
MLHQPAFGRRLRKLRQARGLSQTALAGDGMSTGYLSRLESGARQPTERAVAYLAERLALQAADFEEPAGGSLAHALTLVASTGSDAAMETLREALAAEGHEAPVLRWQALWQLARQRRVQGDHTGERDYLEELVRLGDAVGLVALRVRGLTRLARCLRSLGEITAALDAAVTAHHLAREDGLETQDRATMLLALVSVEAEAGRMPDARGHADELVELVAGRSDALWAEAMWTAAAVRQRQGDHTAAQAYLEEALEKFASGEDLVLWLRLRLTAGQLHLQKLPPDPAAAQRCVTAAEPALAFVGTPGLRQELTALKADLAFLTARYDEARVLLGELAEVESRMTYRGRVRLDILRHRLRIRSGDDGGVQGLRALAEQAQADANIDLAAEIWRILAESLAESAAQRGPAASGV